MCLHSVSVFFPSPILACPFSRGFRVGDQRASLRVALGVDILWMYVVEKILSQYHNFRTYPGPSVKIAVLVSPRDDGSGMKI